MSVKKTIQIEFEPLYKGFERIAREIHSRLNDFDVRLDSRVKPRPLWVRRVISVRNWITHFLLWILLFLSLSSCFVTGRTVHVVTPKVEFFADTATAYSWPYNTKFQ